MYKSLSQYMKYFIAVFLKNEIRGGGDPSHETDISMIIYSTVYQMHFFLSDKFVLAPACGSQKLR